MILFFEKEKNFAKHVQLLNSQLQGQEFFTNMLADLQVAHYYLETFLKKESSFESLIKHVKNIQREAKLKVIETSMQNLTEVKVRFAQISEGLRGIIPRILHFMDKGWFKSIINSSTPSDLCLFYHLDGGETLKLTPDDIDDMVRGINFCNTDNMEPNKKAQLDSFLKCYIIAKSIHEERVKLLDNGHPEYQNSEKKLNEGKKDVNEQALETQLNEMKNLLQSWKENKKNCLDQAPRLLLFNNSQLLTFTRRLTIEIINCIQKNLDSIQVQNILPYLFLLFGENSQEELETSVHNSLKNRKILEKNIDEIQVNILNLCTNLILDIEQELDLEIETLNHKGIAKVYNVKFSEKQLENLLHTQIFTSETPKPYQIIECSSQEHIPKLEDFRIFLSRASKFTTLNFAIIGVNNLSSLYKEELVKMLLDHELPEEFALIFTDETSLQMFTFLKRGDTSIATESEFQKTLNPTNLLQQKNIKYLTYITGKSGDGKTTFIHQEGKKVANPNDQKSHFVVVGINEDFKPIKFYEKIKGYNSENSSIVSVHFNLSAFAPYFIVQKMFRHLLLSGFLIDDESGDVLILDSRISWYFYVEIPTVTKDILENAVLDYLPLLSYDFVSFYLFLFLFFIFIFIFILFLSIFFLHL